MLVPASQSDLVAMGAKLLVVAPARSPLLVLSLRLHVTYGVCRVLPM